MTTTDEMRYKIKMNYKNVQLRIQKAPVCAAPQSQCNVVQQHISDHTLKYSHRMPTTKTMQTSALFCILYDLYNHDIHWTADKMRVTFFILE